MKQILVLGAGRSSASLIKYLLDNAVKESWKIRVGDINLDHVDVLLDGSHHGDSFVFDVNNTRQRTTEISKADLVISMLPARFHMLVAKDCIQYKKHVLTPSYISDEMLALDQDAKDAGIVIMNEVGLDPGIDHMSAMKVIDEIRSNPANEITCFESFCGGLVAPEYDTNPWHYKFTWNPRNVVLAGQGGAVKFIQEGTYKYIPYTKLFRRTEIINVDGFGRFEGYANRDSLKYRGIYGLEGIPTIYRGTLRGIGFCRAWDVFVQLGCTDDGYVIEDSENMTHREFINLFLAYNPFDRVELKLMHYLKIDQDSDLMDKLTWLGIFEDTKIGIPNATPAQVLQHILELKWSLSPGDKDMIVMWHKFGYKQNGVDKEINSSMVVKGDGDLHTAMAMTVGLPIAITAKMVLNGTIKSPGVQLPIASEVYEPILQELESFGIVFTEKEVAPTLYEKA